jgi:predicted 2-oxoglutarate/Fe(II)-dependent dioxygenase YbiX
MVVFGSSTLHEVTTVTRGERFVALGWGYSNHYNSGLR